MKKILLAFDGTQFSEGAFEFARQLNNLHPVLLTGIFVPQLSHASLWSYSTGMAGPSFIPLLEDEDVLQIDNNIHRFEEQCKANHIRYKVYKNFFDFALPELKKETRFADLLIISSETFYSNIVGESQESYLKDVLHAAECAVVIVPEKFRFPKKNIVAYNGSESSVYAIKQFAYLFPELCAHETVLVYAGKNGEDAFPYESRIKELAQQHFMDVTTLQLNKNAQHNFEDWVTKNKNCMLISGSYGRSLLSELFKKSFVNDILATHKLPIFIAHR